MNTRPSPTISGISPVCLDAAGNIYTTQTGDGIHDYQWTVIGGTPTSGGGTGDNTVTVTWNVPGPQSVSVNYTGNNGCPAVTPFTLPVLVNG